ncbi:uncharacterized protein LOC131003104 [Salvia miltiorrhiza]|uniref:uncharacterized protein LOC131003104 n=1 Tax=Salvia miltiorrhiza TaxID=226208 RepID=UPI0025AD0E6E|nr:uncharacterized protein LOC131003104 [Salvia miltiorrhiza]
MLLQTTVAASAFASPVGCRYLYTSKNPTQNPSSFSITKTPFLPPLDWGFHLCGISANTWRYNSNGSSRSITPSATLVEAPVLWAGRLCIFYVLLKTGLAGSADNPIVSDMESGAVDLGFSKWFEELSKPEKEAAERRKLVGKWHPTTKGTLRRNYRVPSKPEGRRLLKAIASVLSDDDHFRDATSHKGCQIRRESAHGESVCCNNVRALFDELPTPHLTVEITPFPAGPLSENDYSKAERLERVLRSGPSV